LEVEPEADAQQQGACRWASAGGGEAAEMIMLTCVGRVRKDDLAEIKQFLERWLVD
jgi:hypothetical protein